MKTRGAVWFATIPIVFLGIFFAYPLVRIIVASFTLDGALDLSAFREVATKGSLRSAAVFTVWQAIASTILTLLLALPATFVLARFNFRGRSAVLAILTVPFVLPTVVVGAAYMALLRPDGPLGIDLRQTAWAILIAHVFFNIAVVVRTVGSFWRLIDPKLEEAARVLGASPWRAFTRTTLPLLRPSLAAAASIVFFFTFTSFGVVLILGGFSFATIEVAVWREATINLDLAASAALAILQLIGVSGALVAYSRYQARRAVALPLRAATETGRPIRTRGERLAVGVILTATLAYLGAPLFILVARSVQTGSGLGVGYYTSLTQSRFVEPFSAIANSLWFATIATVIATTVGLLAAVAISRSPARSGARLDTLLMLPLGTSAVTIGLGFLVSFGWPVDIRTSPWLIPIAHSLIAIPFVIRTATPVLRSVRARLREAAATLGASPRQVFRHIELPIVSRATLVGAGFAFAVSLGEFGATAFLARPNRPTLPTAIFRLLGQPGAANFGQAMALSTILMLLTTGIILMIDRFRVAGLGEF